MYPSTWKELSSLLDKTYVDSLLHNDERARNILTNEVNHIIEAAFLNGCEEMADHNSKMNYIFIDQLHTEGS
ncbi:MAG TPA: hypothetical protein VF095_03575 [Bacillota bacterium]